MSAITRSEASIFKLSLMPKNVSINNRYDLIQHTGFAEWYRTAKSEKRRRVGVIQTLFMCFM